MRAAIISAAALAVAITSVPAMASGSGSRGGGGFGGVSGAQGLSEEDRLIRRGRSQVRKRITCKKCEYRKRLNDETAPEVAQAVRNGKFDLNDKDRVAVLYYLRDRYGI